MRRSLFSTFFILISCCWMGCSSAEKKESAVLHMRLGVSEYESGDFPQALKELLQAENLDPSNPLIQNNLGLCYLMRDRPDLAELHLKKAVQLEKKYTEARNNLARVLIALKKYDEADQELKIVLEDLTFPGVEKAYVHLGISRFERKNWNLAEQAFKKAVEYKKDSCLAWDYLGRVSFEKKNYSEALNLFDKSVTLCQRQLFDEPHYYSGLTLYRMGQSAKAKDRFKEVVHLYPDGQYKDKAQAIIELLNKGIE